MKSLPLITAFVLFLGAATARCQQMPAGRGTVNVTITKQRKMLVDARMNGVAGTFLVDTGAGDSYIGERFAESLHVPRSEGGATYNVMGSMRFDVVDVESFDIGRGRIPLRHALIHVSDLGWVNKSHANAGSVVHGIIGADILILNHAVIDCAQSQIGFGYPGGRGGGPSKITVGFISRKGVELAVRARINGMAGTFIVDTGYNVSLLSPEFANAMGGGAGRSNAVGIKSLEIGGMSIPVRNDRMVVTRRVSIANQGYMDLGEAPYDGVIGMDFLMSHHAVIDCMRMQMRME